MLAKGEFDIDLQPLEPYTQGKSGMTFHRMSINKTFTSDLSAVSRGEMLSALTPISDSAGYVALEQVEGVLDGKRGAFVLQHYGISERGRQRLELEIIPDSGTGELENISGSMKIIIEAGKHFYELEYAFIENKGLVE